jgi:hypothetical protein
MNTIDMVLVERLKVLKWTKAIDLRRMHGRRSVISRKSLWEKKECVEQELSKAGEPEFI